MINISIFNRTTKSEGTIRLRFRLRDGRQVDLYHKSEIRADLSELEAFDLGTGKVKARKTIYNRALAEAISTEMNIMEMAYSQMLTESLPLDGETFEATIAAIKHPATAEKKDASILLVRMDKYIESGVRDGIFGKSRENQYRTLSAILRRYLVIFGDVDMKVKDADADFLMRLRQFIIDEYRYLDDWRHLYIDILPQNLPTTKRNDNTTAIKMKMLQAFFTELEDNEEIEKSPFRRLGKERKHTIMRERYDAPIYLYAAELEKVREAAIPANLEEVRAAFIVQCALGCRVGDFQSLGMEDVAISADGIPYVHYIPQKTKSKLGAEEVETPLVKYAFDIIKERDFNFPILRNITGAYGYNAKIKTLLQACGIERKCAAYNEESGKNEYKPLWEFGSSKLARKTNVDMMSKVQVNLYAAGLHKEGSEAVNHYTSLEMRDRFVLMCAAFRQPLYKVDADFNIVNK